LAKISILTHKKFGKKKRRYLAPLFF